MFAPLLVGIKFCFQLVGKEEQLQYKKHNKQLHDDNDPHLFSPPTHVSETFEVKTPYFPKNILLHIIVFLVQQKQEQSFVNIVE